MRGLSQRGGLVLGLALSAVLLQSQPAAAGQAAGYICSTQLTSAAGSQGNFGALSFTLTSESNCAGTILFSASVCSTGATARWCDLSKDANGVSLYLYDEAQLMALYEALVFAAAEQFQLAVTYDFPDKVRFMVFIAAGWAGAN